MNACSTCQKLKVIRMTPRAPLQPIEKEYPYQRLGIDFMGHFTQTRKGNRYLLVMVDFFTTWVEVTAFPSQETKITAKAIFSEWVRRYGNPGQIHSIQGPSFESRLRGQNEVHYILPPARQRVNREDKSVPTLPPEVL